MKLLSYEPQPVAANFVPLSPLSFLSRAERAYRDRIAIRYGEASWTYAAFGERRRRLAGALAGLGVRPGEVVAVMLPNIPQMLEAQFAVPLCGAIICPINTRLGGGDIGFILGHCKAKVFILDAEYRDRAADAVKRLQDPPVIVEVTDGPQAPSPAGLDYEQLLADAKPQEADSGPRSEWDGISLNYTSGTTGRPKGVLLHHRGAYLNACGNALALGLDSSSVYLWTLPMFHCNGWSHVWATILAGAVNVCLRQVAADEVFTLVARHGVTHLSAAPVVLNMLVNAEPAKPCLPDRPVRVATGGAPPPAPVLSRMEALGFLVTHLYGMTESYGPSAICVEPSELAGQPIEARASFLARQGLEHPTVERVDVLDQAGRPVARDGATPGELVVRSNTVMKGYFDDPVATEAALASGWLHTGDLAVVHPDGYVEIKDRLKDIIISGGENISSIEIEEVFYRHPAVAEAAVVAAPHRHWGETPHAFVALKGGLEREPDAAELLAWCRARLAGFKAPRRLTFQALPKTATGKIQKALLREQAAVLAQTCKADD